MRDCHLQTQQTSRRHTSNYTRACYLCLNNASPVAVPRIVCNVGTKSARPFITSLCEPHWGLTLTELLHPYLHGSTKRDGKKIGRAVNSINSLHSSCKAGSTIDKLNGRSGRSSRLCPISANPYHSQLVKNRTHKAGSCESARLTNKQLSSFILGRSTA